MQLEAVRNYCLSKPGCIEYFPFDADSPVYKVIAKMFAIISLEHPETIALKCDPEKAIDLRERYESVTPGYHMNKTHWNTIQLDGSIPVKLIFEWIDHSYDLVSASLKKKEKEELKNITDHLSS